MELERAYPGAVRATADDLPLDDQSPDLTTLLERRNREQTKADFQVVIHQRWPVTAPSTKGNLTLAYFFWEESRVPVEVVAALNAFDGVLSPADSVTKALRNSGLKRPVRTVGYSPDLDSFKNLYCDCNKQKDDLLPFTILHVSRCYPRKGVDVLLRAYSRAFSSSDNVRLIIRGSKDVVLPSIEAVRTASPEMSPITIIDEELDAAGMIELYRRANVMVLPTRGEGFNVPAAEAIAAGLRLIVTGSGGHMQFCNAGVARLLDFTPVPSGTYPALPESLWSEPDLDDLCNALREAHAGRLWVDDRARKDALAAVSAESWIERIVGAIASIHEEIGSQQHINPPN